MPSARAHDRAIAALALPALGALAAEPLFVLVNTAIVGHLGTTELAALAIAGTVLSSAFTVFNFLTYGTTAHVARMHGGGRRREARAIGIQALWLALAIGIGVGALLAAIAAPLVGLMVGDGTVAREATLYLRLAALGAPGFMLALAGQGHLRGIGDLRTPLLIVVAAQLANALLVAAGVYLLGLGLAGSALATVVAQSAMGGAFAWVQLRAGGRAAPSWARIRPLLAIGLEISVRTTALLGSFLVAGAVLARIGDASVAAHQIAFQLWVFLALVLDALAIAAQVLVARSLGAGAAAAARAASRRVIGCAVIVGVAFALVLLAVTDLLPRAFTGDPDVLAEAAAIWPLFALMMPLNGAVFALDGVLIGAGDTRYLMKAMALAAAVYIAGALLALALDWGIVGVWCGLMAMIGVRLVTLGARFAGDRWAFTGLRAEGTLAP